jgi:hypothetical protein
MHIFKVRDIYSLRLAVQSITTRLVYKAICRAYKVIYANSRLYKDL